MAKDDKISMPNSMGGIVRYTEEYTSKLLLKPEMVIWVIAGVILLFGVLIPLIVG